MVLQELHLQSIHRDWIGCSWQSNCYSTEIRDTSRQNRDARTFHFCHCWNCSHGDCMPFCEFLSKLNVSQFAHTFFGHDGINHDVETEVCVTQIFKKESTAGMHAAGKVNKPLVDPLSWFLSPDFCENIGRIFQKLHCLAVCNFTGRCKATLPSKVCSDDVGLCKGLSRRHLDPRRGKTTVWCHLIRGKH